MDIKERLKKEADIKYQKFSSSLVPNEKTMLGVRLPVLRKIAKEIMKDDYKNFLSIEPEFFEEKMLQGMVIGLIKEENIFEHIKNFIPKINNWSICDSFCAGLKFTKKNKEKVWKFIKPYSKSKKEFELRFFLVMSLLYFVDENYLGEIFSVLNTVNFKDYYAKMGAAWLVSVCYVKFPEITKEFLLKTNLDNETFNKSIRKINESYRVPIKDKNFLKTLKR